MFERLAEATQPCGTDWALGIEARCRAQLSDGAAADGLYREAIDRLGRMPRWGSVDGTASRPDRRPGPA